MNKYGVEVSGPGGVASRPKLSGPKLLCQLKEKVEVTTLTPDLQPFTALPWAPQLPPRQLTSDLGPYKSCAVVSSAGSLRYSGLGKEIGETVDTWVCSYENQFSLYFNLYIQCNVISIILNLLLCFVLETDKGQTGNRQ